MCLKCLRHVPDTIEQALPGTCPRHVSGTYGNQALEMRYSAAHPGPLRGGRWGYFPRAWTNRGPGALVNANVVVICIVCLYCKLLYNPFCGTKNAQNYCTIFKYFKKFFQGRTSRSPFVTKLRLSCSIT